MTDGLSGFWFNGPKRSHADSVEFVVSGGIPAGIAARYPNLELVCAPGDLSRLGFQICEEGRMKFVQRLELDGRVFVPPDPTSRSWPRLILPEFSAGDLSTADHLTLMDDIEGCISQYVELQPAAVPIITSFALASWFPEKFEMMPVLWLVGPLGSAKTKMLRLISCFARRSLLVGDIRPGSLYQLTDTFAPTLLIDELDDNLNQRTREIYKFLRAGASPGARTVRNGQTFSIYGCKVVASRQPPQDQALMSRTVLVSMLPSTTASKPLPDSELEEIARKFQPRLLQYRLSRRDVIAQFHISNDLVAHLTPRTRQIARTLCAPVAQDPERTLAILEALAIQDQSSKVERALELEWLVTESLFRLSHVSPLWSEITVGGISININNWLASRGEVLRVSPRKVGDVLRSLGVPTERLGNLGRGLHASTALFRRVHEVAKNLEIDRRTITPLTRLEHGNAGPSCDICQELGLMGGLAVHDRRNSPGTAGACASGSGRVLLTPGAKRFRG